MEDQPPLPRKTKGASAFGDTDGIFFPPRAISWQGIGSGMYPVAVSDGCEASPPLPFLRRSIWIRCPGQIPDWKTAYQSLPVGTTKCSSLLPQLILVPIEQPVFCIEQTRGDCICNL